MRRTTRSTGFACAAAAALLVGCGGSGGGGGGGGATAAGFLDTSFGGDGIVTQVISGLVGVTGVAVQPDEKIVVVGTFLSGADTDMFAMRLEEDGSLDTSLGGTGVVTVDFSSGNDVARGVALRASDGAIVIVGSTDSVGGGAIAVAVLLSGGLPDPALNGNGQLVIDTTTADDEGRAVAVQIDDRIVVGGTSAASGDLSNFLLYRFLPNGTLDIGADTVNGTGPATVTTGFDDELRALALDPITGDIVIAGFTDANLLVGSDYLVARFLPTGVIDTSFDGDGVQTVDISTIDTATGVQVDLVGRTLLTGWSSDTVASAFSGARLTNAGALDTTWNNVPIVPPSPNGQGRLYYDFDAGSTDTGNGSVIQPDGKLVIAGQTTAGAFPTNAAILRRDSAGLADATFGIAAGGAIYPVNGIEAINAVARDDLGRLVMAGVISTDGGFNYDVLVMRVGG